MTMDRERGLWNTRRLMGVISLVALCLAVLSAGPASAGTGGATTGAPVTLTELQNFNATVNSEARTGLGPTLATVVGIAALALFLSAKVGAGLIAAAGAIAMGFMPGLTSGTFTALAADFTPVAANPFAGHWWSNALGLLYVPMQLVGSAHDPVFWAVLVIGTVLISGLMATARRAASEGA